MTHLRAPDGTVLCDHVEDHAPGHDDAGHGHSHNHEHSHSHGLVDRSIVRSRAGVRAVALSLAILGLAAAGLIGFAGNELAARVRLRAGRRLASAALVADGNHARIDAFVSLGVIASAVLVALGAPVADPLVGLAITSVILKITWDSWHTIRHAEIDVAHVEDEHRPHAPH